MSFKQQEPESFSQQYNSQFEGLQRIVMEGVENLGNVTLQLGESAIQGLGAIASMVGLGSLVPSSSSGSGLSSAPSRDTPTPPVVPNIPTRAATPIVAPAIAIEQAMSNTINRLPESVRDLVDNERSALNKYSGANMNDIALNDQQSPMQTGASMAQAARGMT